MSNPISENDGPVTTEIRLDGANCSLCFNDTARSLMAQPGVLAVNGSIGEQCFRIDHDESVADDRLLSIVSEHLHGDDRSSWEHKMVAVDAAVAQMHCTRGHHTPGSAGGGPGHV